MYWESVQFKGKRTSIKHGIYYEIAMDNLGKSIIEKSEYDKIEKKAAYYSDNDMGKSLVVSNAIQRYLCTCTVFLYLTVESFINFYAAINNISEHEKLERKPTKYKWRRYPRIVTNQEIDNKVIENLEKLTMRRNELVHYKTMGGAEGIEDPTNITVADCEEYNSIVVGMFAALANIDESVKAEVERLQKTKSRFLDEAAIKRI
ncbi:hypothetical protein [Catalinimonas niigatensis]|uniref:hypothetical protein n=1 Tax=Catalinimonas niigatensis TaxID=1397264 RepID=UPI002666AB7E|nr:hypothetical protein [Catalinimonas niigatensis]WPP53563.1 hypothetical protein PZB72_14410 [Catalinimonas niigatensis]